MHEDNRQSNGRGNFYESHESDFAGDPQHPDFEQNDAAIDWQASEYVHHAKGVGWLAILVVVAVAVVGLAAWTQQWTFAVLATVMAVAFGVYGFRQPREVQYHLSSGGLQINDKTYALDSFRAFRVSPDGAFFSAQLIPVKRFLPAITIYFSEPDGDTIVDILSDHMPMEETSNDLLDILMRRMRF